MCEKTWHLLVISCTVKSHQCCYLNKTHIKILPVAMLMRMEEISEALPWVKSYRSAVAAKKGSTHGRIARPKQSTRNTLSIQEH